MLVKGDRAGTRWGIVEYGGGECRYLAMFGQILLDMVVAYGYNPL